MNDFDKFMDSIADDDLSNVKTTKQPVEGPTTYPCISCDGTGLWGMYRSKPCFACNGTGERKMTAAEQRNRKAGAAKARVTRANNLIDRQEAFEEQHPDMIETLRSYTSWNDFARSLVEQFQERGHLSDKQIESAKRMIDKVNATRAAKAEEEKANAMDVSNIEKMFEHAKANGKEKPFFKADGLKIYEAPAHGRNAGSLYVKMLDGNGYIGKITAGVFKPFDCPDVEDIEKRLVKIAANPEEAARAYGRDTKRCSVCKARLTHPDSVEAGIGPVCREKFFG